MKSRILPFTLCKRYMSLSVWRPLSCPQYGVHCRPNLCVNSTIRSTSYIAVSSLHTSTILTAKTFQDKENEYAHSIFVANSVYVGSTVKYPLTKPPLRDESMKSEFATEVNRFSEATSYAASHDMNLENEQFNEVVAQMAQKLAKLSDDELVDTLHLLCLWQPSPRSYSPNFKLLWNKLDSECAKRFKVWDINRKFIVADYWFYLRLNRISKYNKELVINLLGNLNVLSDIQVVQLMFLIILQRKVPQEYMKNLEKRLVSVISSVSLQEIGIICLGFFKTESKITDFNTIQLIINRFLKEVKNVNPVTAVSILKFLKKSMHLVHTDKYIPLLHVCVPCIQCWDVKAAIHLALLSSECHVHHPLLLNTVLDKVSKCLNDAYIKDCTKLLQCLAHFNHPPGEHFTSLFLKEIVKKDRVLELKNHPRDWIYSALYFAYFGFYSDVLTHRALDPKFMQYCKSKCPETSNAFTELDYCIEIEGENYSGPRLGCEERTLRNDRRGNMPDDPMCRNILTKIMKEVIDSLLLIVGKDEIMVRHILPHLYSPDIIVRLSKKKDSLSNLYSNFPSEKVLKPPSNETWACFVVSAPFSFAYKSRQMTGVTAMKLRQLEKLRYKVIFIPFYEIPTSPQMRKIYLQSLLEVVQKSCEPDSRVEKKVKNKTNF